jgi:hypothetical protein
MGFILIEQDKQGKMKEKEKTFPGNGSKDSTIMF